MWGSAARAHMHACDGHGVRRGGLDECTRWWCDGVARVCHSVGKDTIRKTRAERPKRSGPQT
eukprot:12654661-Alexandrium_andersonii.AAC.1